MDMCEPTTVRGFIEDKAAVMVVSQQRLKEDKSDNTNTEDLI
jgi:hypothetical protein